MQILFRGYGFCPPGAVLAGHSLRERGVGTFDNVRIFIGTKGFVPGVL